MSYDIKITFFALKFIIWVFFRISKNSKNQPLCWRAFCLLLNLWKPYQGVQHLSRVQFTDFTDNLLTNQGQIYWHTDPQNRISGPELSIFRPILRELEKACIWMCLRNENHFGTILLTFHQKSHFYWHFPDIFPPFGHFTDIYWLYWLYWHAGHPGLMRRSTLDAC